MQRRHRSLGQRTRRRMAKDRSECAAGKTALRRWFSVNHHRRQRLNVASAVDQNQLRAVYQGGDVALRLHIDDLSQSAQHFANRRQTQSRGQRITIRIHQGHGDAADARCAGAACGERRCHAPGIAHNQRAADHAAGQGRGQGSGVADNQREGGIARRGLHRHGGGRAKGGPTLCRDDQLVTDNLGREVRQFGQDRGVDRQRQGLCDGQRILAGRGGMRHLGAVQLQFVDIVFRR